MSRIDYAAAAAKVRREFECETDHAKRMGIGLAYTILLLCHNIRRDHPQLTDAQVSAVLDRRMEERRVGAS